MIPVSQSPKRYDTLIKNSPNSVSFLPMPFALNCMMVN